MTACNANGDFAIVSWLTSNANNDYDPAYVDPFKICLFFESIICANGGLREAHMTLIPTRLDGTEIDRHRDATREWFRLCCYPERLEDNSVTADICSALIGQALVRMRARKMVLPGKVEKAVARAYGVFYNRNEPTFKTFDEFLPEPRPAIDVNQLASMVLSEPLFHTWAKNSGLHKVVGHGWKEKEATPETFQLAVDHLSQYKMERDRIYTLVSFMTFWYSLDDEDPLRTAALLWELRALQNYSREGQDGAKHCMKNNALFQLMINGYFNVTAGMTLEDLAPDELLSFQQYEITVGIAPPSENTYDNGGIFTPIPATMKKATRALENTGCVICGTTNFQTGDTLMQYAGCKSFLYCCKDHQILHWENGHKKDCCNEDQLRRRGNKWS